jgi:GDPmannose 4,6-dehydratase
LKKAFITGINGQDGSNLSRLLISKGYEVHGIVRRNSVPEHQELRIDDLTSQIRTYYGEMSDSSTLAKLLREVRPDEIYNLAAQSHVRISFDIPQFTVQTNALGTLNLLEAYRAECPEARFYQASSSEMFGTGVDDDLAQRETTPMLPTSPYGCAKLFAYHIVRNYRKSYKLYASNGILFNHESPMRGSNFVTSKVIKGAVLIKLGRLKQLEMGNMDSSRDWGHSRDYVRAMHMILSHDQPDDFVVATGITRSVRQMCEFVFSYLGLKYEDHISINPKFFRPEELPYLRGDSTKMRSTLDWKPEITFEEMMVEMIEYWMAKLKAK